MNAISPCDVCVKFPEIKTDDPEEMFKLALFFKFPSIRVVVFPLKTISPVLVSDPLFGVNAQIQACC